jgi:hypothetical protein
MAMKPIEYRKLKAVTIGLEHLRMFCNKLGLSIWFQQATWHFLVPSTAGLFQAQLNLGQAFSC